MSRKRHDLLREEKWSCTEAVELNREVYKKLLVANTSSAGTGGPSQPSRSTTELSVVRIRIAAVHRQVLAVTSLHISLREGINFAETTLEDHGTADVLRKLQGQTSEILSCLSREEHKIAADSAQQMSDSTSPAGGTQGAPNEQQNFLRRSAGLAIWEAVQQSIAKMVRDPVDEEGEHQAPVFSNSASGRLGCRRVQMCLKVTPDASPMAICPYHTIVVEDLAS